MNAPLPQAPPRPNRPRIRLLVGLGVGYLHTGAGKAKIKGVLVEKLHERVNGTVDVGEAVRRGELHGVENLRIVEGTHAGVGPPVEAAAHVAAVVERGVLLQQRIARALVLPHGRRAQLLSRPAQRARQCREFTHRHGTRQGRREALCVRLLHRTSIGQVEGQQTPGSRPNHR